MELRREEQLALTETERTELVEVLEPYQDTIAHQEVVKPIGAPPLVVASLEVAHHLQGIMEHAVVPHEHLPTEVLEVEPTADLTEVAQELPLAAEVLIDRAVLVEVVEEAIAHQDDQQEAQVAIEVQEVHLDLRIQGEDPQVVADHLEEDLQEDVQVVVEGVNKPLKFQYVFIKNCKK